MASLREVKKFISSYEFFYVVGHERPDGDCIGSQLAMSGLLQSINKKHLVLSAGPFADSLSQSYRSRFVESLDDLDFDPLKIDNSALIMLDASSPDRMGEVFSPIYSLPTLIIDHHASTNESFGNVRYIDAHAPANTILIYRLIKTFELKLTQEIAYYIFLGLLTDTQFFRFVKREDKEPFEVAAELVSVGVSPGDIHKQISYGYTYLSRKVIAKVLERTRRINNNRIIITYIRYSDYIHSDDIPQSFEIYQLLEGTHKNEIVVYLQEVLDDDNEVITKVGMRSKSFDVGNVAKNWGGGGHTNASGFTLKKVLEESLTTLIDYFDTLAI